MQKLQERINNFSSVFVLCSPLYTDAGLRWSMMQEKELGVSWTFLVFSIAPKLFADRKNQSQTACPLCSTFSIHADYLSHALNPSLTIVFSYQDLILPN